MNLLNLMQKRAVDYLANRCLNRQIARYGELIAENDNGVRVFRRKYQREIIGPDIDITRTVKMRNPIFGKLVRTVIKEWPWTKFGWSFKEQYRVTNDVTGETKRVDIIRSPFKDFRNKVEKDDGELDLSSLLWGIVPKSE